jgi:16S rRNA U516 pseudouridylate synthase RsuA-like enzyme
LRVTLKEGHKRQLREMGSQTGLPVVRIIRTRMGTLHLGNLKPREWRLLTEQEVSALKEDYSPQRLRGQRNRPHKRIITNTQKLK